LRTNFANVKNVAWMSALGHSSNSSPIVWGNNVFVSGLGRTRPPLFTREPNDPTALDRLLYCFDRKTGKVRWFKGVRYEKEEPTHDTNPHGASSPAADGKRVVLWHGSAGVYCYDHDGNELWHRDLGVFSHIWGYGSSPLILDDRIILNCGPGKRTFVTALDTTDGHTLWETPEPGGADDQSPETKTWIGSWSSPVPVMVDGKQQVLVAMPRHVNAYDPATGKIIWYCEGTGDLAYTDPVIGDGIAVYQSGSGGPAIAFKLGGSGNVTATNLLWRDEGKNPERIGSGVIIGPNLYQISEPGIIQCVEAATNKELWKTTLKGQTFWASLVAADNRIYATSQKGDTIVFAADPKEFKSIAKNSLGERTNSTPAISNGQMFIRTAESLWCVEDNVPARPNLPRRRNY
jgi:outer membrane protein assembly factor BamB